MGAIKGFWKHVGNGRIYAIECTPFGRITGACGPLDPYNLPDLEEIEYGKDILIWIETTITEGKLHRFNVDPPEDPAGPNPVISRNMGDFPALKK